MTIASRLRINALITIGIVIVLGLMGVLAFKRQRESRERGMVAGEVLVQASELRSLSVDFLRHPEERSKQEFLRVQNALENTLSGTSLRQYSRATARMLQNLSDVKFLFAELAASFANGGSALTQAGREILADEILARTNQISLDASRALALNNAELERVTRQITILTTAIAAVLAMVVLWSSRGLYRAIAGPLQALHRGTDTVGAGNLAYRVGTASQDEIGQVSRSFDHMTEQLQHDMSERKRAEEALRASEQQWVITLQSIGDAVMATDAVGKITFVNPLAESLLEMSSPDCLGKPIDDIFRVLNELTGEPLESPVTKAMRLNRVIELGNNAMLLGNKGARTPIADSAAPIRDASGNMSGVVLVFRDVTERRRRDRERAQILLQEQVQRQIAEATASRLRKIESVTEAILARLPLDKMLQQLLRRTAEALQADMAVILLRNEQTQMLEARAALGLEEEALAHIQIPVGQGVAGTIAKTGQLRIVDNLADMDVLNPYLREKSASLLGAPLVVEDRVIGVIHVDSNKPRKFTDSEATLLQMVADRIALAIDHRRSEERIAHLASFPELNPIVIFETDLQGRITYVNPEAQKRFPDLQQGMNHPLLAEWPSLLDAGAQQIIVREVETNGSVFEETIHFPPELRLARAYLTDITERKRAEARLKDDVSALTQMHALSEKILGAAGLQPLLQEVMNAAVAIMKAQRGTLQLLEGDTLRIVAHYGHERPFLDFFASAENRASVCGEAMLRGERVVVPDVENSPLFAGTPSLPVLREGGVRAVQSTPLVSRTGVLLGILTTQWSAPYSPSEHDLWRIGLLARQGADLIEHAQAEEALRASDAKMQTIVGSAMDAVISIDEQQRIVVFNRAAEQIFQCAASEALGSSLDRFIPSQLRDVHRKHIWEFGATGLTTRSMRAPGALRALRNNGEEFPIEATISHAQSGKEKILTVILRDITERKRAEEALRASEERWSTTLRSIGDAVISTDAAGKIVFMNEVAQKLTGWPLAEVEDKDLDTVFNIVQEVTRIKPESSVSKVIRLGKVVGLANHTLLIKRDGTEIAIEDSGAPIRNREGEIEGVVLVFHDVSEQRKMEHAVRTSNRLATTGRLAATIAHEIHNPLDAVGNLLYLINQSTKEKQIQEFVALASEELARVTQMTQQMLTFQRESAKPVPVQIKEVFDNVVALYQRKIESGAIRIEQQVDVPHPLLAQPGELRQVIANLLGNAIEAVGRDHGRIWLRAHVARDWRRGRSGIRVLVADNGRGIPANVRERIFDPFFTTKGESGTGLGLWITSDIIRKYDGTIRLRSSTRPGRSGTCFSIFFPDRTLVPIDSV
jgi:PAS domain S-box-containing protein